MDFGDKKYQTQISYQSLFIGVRLTSLNICISFSDKIEHIDVKYSSIYSNWALYTMHLYSFSKWHMHLRTRARTYTKEAQGFSQETSREEPWEGNPVPGGDWECKRRVLWLEKLWKEFYENKRIICDNCVDLFSDISGVKLMKTNKKFREIWFLFWHFINWSTLHIASKKICKYVYIYAYVSVKCPHYEALRVEKISFAIKIFRDTGYSNRR